MKERIEREYKRWLKEAETNPILAVLLAEIAGDDALIADCYYRDLAFGTGGIRGILGAGTNRMNIYTVGKSTQGLADYLLQTEKQPSVCIACDTRNMSLEFAQTAAAVLCANGIKVYLYETPHPTPMLSFAVRHRKASCGIVVTASHNPKEYNGCKVYNADGGQITDAAAAEISVRIAACDIFSGVKRKSLAEALADGSLVMMDDTVDSAYYEKVKNLILRKELVRGHAAELNMLYTPLHGSGNIPVRRVLKELGFANVTVVPEQEKPDGSFPTADYPNPEEPSVYALAIEMAKELHPDLIFATDPDCDRIGVLTQDENGAYVVLSGNQTGALLCEYILSARKERGNLPKNAAVVKTIVTTELVRRICAAFGAALIEVLTGFKYIGEKIGEWAQSGEYSFMLGFEESYGYLAGDFVRDKDAVIASALIAEMALYYKNKGLTLYDALQQIYARYGYAREALLSVEMPGQDGQAQIAALMQTLRCDYQARLAGQEIAMLEDYSTGMRTRLAENTQEAITLPKSDVLKFIFADGAWLVLRPSGTEPKIKLYLSVDGETAEATEKRLAELEGVAKALLKS